MTERIWFYSNVPEYSWLSNFHMCSILIGGRTYRSVEHYYQAEKADSMIDRQWVMDAPTPYQAMKAGKSVRIRDDWTVETRIETMRIALRAKFTYNKGLGNLLLETGDAILHEKSRHPLWGGIAGRDMLGKLLMEIREELKNG